MSGTAGGMRQIKASAGSGKTWTLTRAFLERLQGCVPDGTGRQAQACAAQPRASSSPESIIAITFTNAAATEMRQRILGELKKAVLGLAASPALSQDNAERWLGHILNNANALNVRTIDSLLHLIVRSAALALGIPPDYQPAFSTPEMMENALNILLEQANTEKEARSQNNGPSDCGQNTLNLLHAAFDGLATYGNTKGFLAGDKINQDLRLLLDDILCGRLDNLSPLDDVRDTYDQIERQWRTSAKQLLLCAPEKGLQANAAKFLVNVRDGNFVLAAKSAYYMHTDWNRFFCKGTSGADLEKTFATYIAAATTYVEQGSMLKLALRLGPFVALGKRLQQIFLQSPEAFNQLPNSRIPDYVKALLSAEQGIPETLCRLGNRLTHFLVDEFQDTSQGQWEAMAPLVHEALAHGGSFTWVGDVKQSIYSWRGGNAALFDSILDTPPLQGMGQAIKENLPYNWRSKANIVFFNNAMFSPLAQKEHAALILGHIVPSASAEVAPLAASRIAATFAQCSQAMPDMAAQKGDDGFVAVVEVDKEDLFERLVEDISQTHAIRPWSDMLVLVPRHKIGSAIAEALIQADIPVVTENSLLLGKHPLVVQTVALLQFLHTPADDTALWTVITGSMAEHTRNACGVTVAQLTDWRASSDNKGWLYMELPHAWPALWQALIAPIINPATTLTPYELVVLWFAHTRAEQHFPNAALFLRRFLEIVFMAESKNILTLAGFLELWEGEHAEEKVPMPEGMDAVRIMTVHKAKGLEKAVVFVPSTDMKAKINDAIITKNIAGFDVAIPLQKGVEPEYSTDLARSACELLHTLYVALTRARDALFVYHDPNNKALIAMLDKGGFGKETVIGTIPPAEDNEEGEAPAEQKESGNPEHVLEENVCAGYKPEIKIFRNPELSALEARERGEFLHHCLEHIDLATPRHDTHKAAAQALTLALQRHRHPYAAVVAETPLEQKQLLSALQWFAAQPEAPHWLAVGIPEISLTDGKGNLFRVDLLVRQDNETLVLDYKSGDVENKHIAQVRNYLRLLSLPDNRTPTNFAILVYLDKRQFRMVDAKHVTPLCDSVAQCRTYLGNTTCQC